MRIRTIKPEFWTSEDIAVLGWEARFLFVGLWSYVDDNGVGRDNEKLICAALFPLEDNPRDTLAKVSRGLQTLFEAGRISRYTVDGKGYLHITNWDKHQKIDRPNKPRYPLPTSENVDPRPVDASVSRDSRECPSSGTEDQRNRVLKDLVTADAVTASNEASTDADSKRWAQQDRERTRKRDAGRYSEFDRWWGHYPRKVSKGAAMKAFAKARKEADLDTLTAAVKAYAKSVDGKDPEFIPHGSTWLNNQRWLDEDITPTTEADIESWLNDCWSSYNTKAISDRTGIYYDPPDPPNDCADLPAFHLQAKRDWIKTRRDDIVRIIKTRECIA